MNRSRSTSFSSVEIGRGAAERINGDRSLVLERPSCERVLVAALGGAGLLGEFTDLLARLRAERAARACVAVVLPIKRGTAQAARRLVEEGPPFEVERLGFERHHVFVSEREVVFFFEGDSATAAVDALSRNPRVLKAALRWRGILAGRPRLAEERFGWTGWNLTKNGQRYLRRAVVRTRGRSRSAHVPDASPGAGRASRPGARAR